MMTTLPSNRSLKNLGLDDWVLAGAFLALALMADPPGGDGGYP